MRFLMFTLYAPMASFGEVAIGERRMGWSRPGRSALLGVVASALGVERADEAGQSELDHALRFAVRVDAPGTPMTDYHTAQVPTARKRETGPRTRREELARPKLNTVLSVREWRTDACFTIAAWGSTPEQASVLDDIARTLRAPRLSPFLGRKSAPLGLPPHPTTHEAESIVDAFHQRQHTAIERELLDVIAAPHDGPEGTLVASDMDAPGLPADHRTERRRDAVVSRARWQFADRVEAVFWLNRNAN